MIQNALDLSKQYLSKSSIILIILLFIFFALFKILLNYGLDNDIISKNFWDITVTITNIVFHIPFIIVLLIMECLNLIVIQKIL